MSHQLTLEEYSEKSFVIRGDSKEYKEQLKTGYGKWNTGLKGGPGWIFSKKNMNTMKLFVNKINNETELEEERKEYNQKFKPMEAKYDSDDEPLVPRKQVNCKLEKEQRKELEEQKRKELEQQKELEEQKELKKQQRKELKKQQLKELEEQIRKELEEQIRKELEEQIRKELKKQQRKELKKIRKELEEQIRKELEEQIRKELEEQIRKELKKIRKELEEQIRKELEEQIRKELEEQIRKELEEQIRKELEACLEKCNDFKIDLESDLENKNDFKKDLESHPTPVKEETMPVPDTRSLNAIRVNECRAKQRATMGDVAYKRMIADMKQKQRIKNKGVKPVEKESYIPIYKKELEKRNVLQNMKDKFTNLLPNSCKIM
jgi:hypothetical protein